MKQYVAISIGPILTAIGLLIRYRRKSVETWLSERRIDNKSGKKNVCHNCGAPMKDRTSYTGDRKGLKAKVCSNYPECRNIRWGE